MEDCYSHVSSGYGVVRSYCSFNRAGGAETLDGTGGGGRQQRGNLRDRGADGTVRVYSGESVLHRGVRGEPAIMDTGSGELHSPTESTESKEKRTCAS